MDQLLDRSINGPTQAQPLKEEEWVKLVLLSEKVRQGDKVYYLEKDGRLYHEPNCVILPLGAIPLLPGDIPGDFKPCMFCNPRLIHR